MATATYTGPVGVSGAKPSAPARKGFWSRVLDALIESRMRQAEREIAQYRRLHKNLIDQAQADEKSPSVR
jgi:hypothetical protein